MLNNTISELNNSIKLLKSDQDRKSNEFKNTSDYKLKQVYTYN